ncbi:MAG: hypothetical protein OXC93_11370 [Rhodospirillaceae bacterium]|nr:hypothetical protein [Rhodospirillaceae bacterium]
MTIHRYPHETLRNDYLRAGAGLLICAPLAIVAWGTSFGMWLFLGMSALFAVYGLRSWLRSITEYRLTGDGLTLTNTVLSSLSGRYVPWTDLNKLTLRFFPLRRDRSEGWMQLTVRTAHVRFSIDSTLEEFNAIAKAALAAGLRNELPMTQATLENFQALGVDPAHMNESA